MINRYISYIKEVLYLLGEMAKHWHSIHWNDISKMHHNHKAVLLKLNCDKAIFDLSWQSAM
jgi:hypothetical protein